MKAFASQELGKEEDAQFRAIGDGAGCPCFLNLSVNTKLPTSCPRELDFLTSACMGLCIYSVQFVCEMW